MYEGNHGPASELLLVAQTGTLDVMNVIAATWSPRGTYMQTYERPSKEQGNAHKNLKVTPPHVLRLNVKGVALSQGRQGLVGRPGVLPFGHCTMSLLCSVCSVGLKRHIETYAAQNLRLHSSTGLCIRSASRTQILHFGMLLRLMIGHLVSSLSNSFWRMIVSDTVVS